MRPNHRLHRPAKQRGQILIIIGLSLIVLVGMTGVALDSGRGYAVKAKLNAAVDAAAIAAARAISEGDTDTDRIANAQSAAQRFFNLNYPSEYFGAPRPTPSVSAARDAERRWIVSVSATTPMPTTFARVLGRNSLDVHALGQTVRRQLDVMLVLDTSGSLGPPTSSSSVFPALKAAAINGFVNKFAPTDDRVGLVSFSSGAVLDVPIDKTSARGFNKTTLANAINNLPLGGATATAESMRIAIGELDAVPSTLRSDLRVVLLFSDGAPNIVSGTFVNRVCSPYWPYSCSNQNVDGNLYSETSSGGAPYRVWRYNYRDYYLNDYDDISVLPSTGRGATPLASYNNARTLSGSPITNSRCNVNKAARNMIENLANTARGSNPPIFVYTIGLGVRLESLEITFCGYSTATEKGSNILNRLANSVTSDTRNAAQPTGYYCWAASESQLEGCFSRIASEVLRLAI